MSTEILKVSLLEVETGLRPERDAWSMITRPRQATYECAPPPLLLLVSVSPALPSPYHFTLRRTPSAHSLSPEFRTAFFGR